MKSAESSILLPNFEMQLAHHSIEWMIDGFSLNYHNGTHGVVHPSLLEVIGNVYESPELLAGKRSV